jgi:hypothetical protein
LRLEVVEEILGLGFSVSKRSLRNRNSALGISSTRSSGRRRKLRSAGVAGKRAKAMMEQDPSVEIVRTDSANYRQYRKGLMWTPARRTP